MKKAIISFMLIPVLCAMVWADDVDLLCQKLPEDTLGFAATSGLDAAGDDFNKTALGQIAADPQVQSFFKQLFQAFSALEEFKLEGFDGLPDDYLALVKELLRSPTVGSISINAEAPDEATVYLLSKTVTDTARLRNLLETALQPAIVKGTIRVQNDSNHVLFISNDPNQSETFYIALANGYVAAAVDDDEYTLLNRLSSGSVNTKLANLVSSIGLSQKAIIYYVDYQKMLPMMEEEMAADPDIQMLKKVLESLGLDEIRYNLASGGFEGSNIVLRGQLNASTAGGIWNVLEPADRSLLGYADPKAMQAGVVKINPGLLYDIIFQTVKQVNPKAVESANTKIAEIEALLDFKIRQDFLENLEGSFMGYTLPAYSSPELQVGGYVLTAKVRDAEKIEQCLLHLGTVIQSMAPPNQVQITTQESISGKPIHIWAVSVMAMLQVIPSWTIEGDMLIIASHPNLTRRVLEQYETAGRDSLLSNPTFAGLLNEVPYDACAIVLTDSKAQARQLVLMLQRFWPLMTMGLMNEGIQLPIMLPSIDVYIEQMEPGYRYARKGVDGIDWYYEGTCLEGGIGGTGGMGGAAMGMAILMPALSKTRQIAQRVVSGTNLKEIGIGCMLYANDHDDQFPSNLQVLVSEYNLSPEMLTSARKPDSFDGPSYILIEGLTAAAPANLILVYENPAFCKGEEVNVLFLDAHVEAMELAAFKEALQRTYAYLQKPLPEMDW